MAYTTTALVKTYAGIGRPDDDTLIGTLVTRAQAIVDAYCRRTFEASADSTRYFTVGRDTEGRYLWFDEDIASITTVTNGDSTTITSAQYVTVPTNRTPYHGIKILSSAGKVWTYTTDPENAISIAGKWAYSTTAPADIVQATIRLATFLYRQKDTSQDITNPIMAGNGLVILPGQIPKDIQMILNPYRRL